MCWSVTPYLKVWKQEWKMTLDYIDERLDLLLVDSVALPLVDGGALLLVLSPTGRS